MDALECQDQLLDEIRSLVTRWAHEADISVLVVVGCLELVKQEIMESLPLQGEGE